MEKIKKGRETFFPYPYFFVGGGGGDSNPPSRSTPVLLLNL